jgi:hypothetical protein
LIADFYAGESRLEKQKSRPQCAVGIFCFQRADALSNRGFGGLNQLDKTGIVVDGDFGEHFAVQVDVGFDQPFNESAVGDAVRFAGGIDTYSPEAAESALFLFAMNIGHRLGAIYRFGSLTEKFAAVPVEPFSEFQTVFSAAA